jgi:hypothetical protein
LLTLLAKSQLISVKASKTQDDFRSAVGNLKATLRLAMDISRSSLVTDHVYFAVFYAEALRMDGLEKDVVPILANCRKAATKLSSAQCSLPTTANRQANVRLKRKGVNKSSETFETCIALLDMQLALHYLRDDTKLSRVHLDKVSDHLTASSSSMHSMRQILHIATMVQDVQFVQALQSIKKISSCSSAQKNTLDSLHAYCLRHLGSPGLRLFLPITEYPLERAHSQEFFAMIMAAENDCSASIVKGDLQSGYLALKAMRNALRSDLTPWYIRSSRHFRRCRLTFLVLCGIFSSAALDPSGALRYLKLALDSAESEEEMQLIRLHSSSTDTPVLDPENAQQRPLQDFLTTWQIL